MGQKLIVGSDEVVGIELAGQLLRSGEDRVVWMIGDADDSVQNALTLLVTETVRDGLAGQEKSLREQEIMTRFRVVDAKFTPLRQSVDNSEVELQADEIWCLHGWVEEFSTAYRSSLTLAAAAASWLSGIEMRLVNYVDYLLPAECDSHHLRPRARPFEEYCGSRGIGRRLFHLGTIVGDRYLRSGAGGGSILRVMQQLDEFISEIEERQPDFFDCYALHVFSPPQSSLNLISVRAAVECMLRIASQKATIGSEYNIVSPEDISAKDFYECVANSYGISVQVTDDVQTFNAVDRLFDSRLETTGIWHCQIPRGLEAMARQAANFPAARLVVPKDMLRNAFESIRRQQVAASKNRNYRVAQLPARLQRKTIVRQSDVLTYFSTESEGPLILILNALGQGLGCWYRLIDQLMDRHRVLIWETRGLTSDSSPLRLADHVEDVKAILDTQRDLACFLIGWCTGPQVAMEFYLRYPGAVRGMAFLNSACKLSDRLDLETPYASNLERLCQLINEHPERAPFVTKALRVSPVSDINLMGNEKAAPIPDEVLSLTNTHLRAEVLAPYRTAETMVRYSAQVLDFTLTHTSARVPEILAPVLIVGCECDTVAKAEKSTELARRFPNCTYVQLPGATHYVFYDRPAYVAKLLIKFFAGCC